MLESDLALNKRVAPNLLRLAQAGIFFPHNLGSRAGTFRSLQAILTGIMVPENAPLLPKWSIDWQQESSNIVTTLLKYGYKPEFYYGGDAQWLQLGKWSHQLGFGPIRGTVIAEQGNSEDYYMTRPDRDLFAMAAQALVDATAPTFQTILTGSNHPPYIFEVPTGMAPLHLPQKFRVFDQRDRLQDALRGYQYADYALGEFVNQLQEADILNDTLLIVTADHNDSNLVRPHDQAHDLSHGVPLIWHAPAILPKTANPVTEPSSHFDILPTLRSLLQESLSAPPMNAEPKTIAFGRNLLAPTSRKVMSTGQGWTCTSNQCLFDIQQYNVGYASDTTSGPESASLYLKRKAKGPRTEFAATLEDMGLAYLQYLPRLP